MTPPLFFADRERLVAGPTVVLDGAEGRHAATVRRLGPGERVLLGDGAGLLVECAVRSVGRAALTLTVVDRRNEPRPPLGLVVVQALAKGDRGELAVEQLTEVGVDEIVPWAAARSVVRWNGERGRRAVDRWRATAREAAKQSRRAWRPLVTDLATTATVVERLRRADLAVLLTAEAAAPLGAAAVPDVGTVVVVVGPEGGLTGEEMAAFVAAGGSAYRLGPTLLRTSSAGLAAAAVLLARTSRWG